MCQHNLPCSIVYAHCLLPGRAFASLYVLLFLEKEAEIGGRVYKLFEFRLMTTRITLFGDSYIEHLDSHIDQFNTNTLTVSDIGYLLIKYKFILVYFYFNCSHGNLFDNFFLD